MHRRLAPALLVALAATSLPASVHARAKTDLVFLENGDRLTGEIKELSRGILKLSTDAISTVSIEWADVDSVNSVYQFRVEDSDARKLFGAIFMRRDGVFEVVLEGQTWNMPADSVVSIVPLEASFWQQLDGAVSLGYSYTKSDKLSQLTLNGWVLRRTSIRQTRFDASATLTNTEGTEATVRYDASLDHRRLLKGKLFAELAGGAQRNDELGLDLRTSVAGGFGANLITTNRAVLVAGVGLSVNREWANDGTRSDNLEGVLTGEHAIFAYNYPKTDYSTTLSVFPSLTDWGRVRAELDIHARREIVKDFFVELTFYDSYDSRPPGGSSKTDYGLVFSLGYSF